jgi:hypothetical protein
MMKGESSNKLRPVPYDHGFTDTLLSWSLEQIENQDLFKDQVCLALIKHSLSFFFSFSLLL